MNTVVRIFVVNLLHTVSYTDRIAEPGAATPKQFFFVCISEKRLSFVCFTIQKNKKQSAFLPTSTM
jgi:hypothetical protein